MSSPDHTASPACGLLLASQSPRRRRLLSWLGLPFEIAAVDTPEELDSPLAADPEALARHLAAEKARAAREEGLAGSALALTLDTIVVHDGRILGKPADLPDAWRMLRALSGQTHRVITGVAMLPPRWTDPDTFAVVTEVRMKPLTDCQIEAWMAVGEFMGCAGAYNIEGQVAEVPVSECFQNVAGIPLCHIYRALKRDAGPDCGLGEPRSPVPACDSALQRRCTLGPSIVGTQAPHGA